MDTQAENEKAAQEELLIFKSQLDSGSESLTEQFVSGIPCANVYRLAVDGPTLAVTGRSVVIKRIDGGSGGINS